MESTPTVALNFNKNQIPVRWGIITGLLMAILSTANFVLLIDSYGFFLISSVVANFVLPIVFYCVAGAQQRKAMGGMISFKEVFRAIFITMLFALLISTIWGIIYSSLIDPHLMEKMRDATVDFMERMKVPQDKIDEAVENFNKQVGKGIVWSEVLLGFAKILIVHSIIGMICAAIIKRKPKEVMR